MTVARFLGTQGRQPGNSYPQQLPPVYYKHHRKSLSCTEAQKRGSFPLELHLVSKLEDFKIRVQDLNSFHTYHSPSHKDSVKKSLLFNIPRYRKENKKSLTPFGYHQ